MATKNIKIIEEFEKLIKQIKFDIDHSKSKSDVITNQFRLRQIKNATDIIKKYPLEIKSGEQLKDIKGVGKGTISRINEIINKGFLSEIKIETKEERYLKQIEELQEVFGIGRKTAYDLIINYNIKSVDQLKKAYNKGTIDLPYHVILGLKYYNVYQQKAPRTELDTINTYIGDVIKSIDSKGDLCHVICGSYRRLKETSNDIDILLTHKKVKTLLDQKKQSNYLKILVKKLTEQGFILDDIDKDYEVKYMGYCKYKTHPVRRIDIMYIPYESYYTALLHFTGSGEFNRKMRDVAIELGYTLSQLGLYVVKNGKKTKRIKITSEKEIFDNLGMEYIQPQNRN